MTNLHLAPSRNENPDSQDRDARGKLWREENAGAIADANAYLDRHGLWSDGRRQFSFLSLPTHPVAR